MLNRLLVVLDEFDSSEVAATEALRVAEEHGSSLLLAGIVPAVRLPLFDVLTGSVARQRTAEARVRARVENAAREAARRGRPTTVQLLDPPHLATSLISLAQTEGCDTIIIASNGRSALARLLAGSLIPGLITYAPMPVLVCQGHRQDRPAPAPRTDSPLALLRRLIQRRRARVVGRGLAGAPA